MHRCIDWTYRRWVLHSCAVAVFLLAGGGPTPVYANSPPSDAPAKARLEQLNRELERLTAAVEKEGGTRIVRRRLEDEPPSHAEAALAAWHQTHDAEYQKLLQRLAPPPEICTDPPPVAKPNVDDDRDGIPDQLEQALLTKFRPYYCFSSTQDHEPYNPVGAGFYLTVSEINENGDEDSHTILEQTALAADISNSLKLNYKNYGFSDLTKTKAATNYHLNPLANVPGFSKDPGRHGLAWRAVKASGHLGLYGHVTPIRLKQAEAYTPSHVPHPSDEGDVFYKIEFWQFFGYSDTRAVNDVGDHEGDWCTVQLLYSPARDAAGDKYSGICTVLHYAHGKEMRFNLAAVKGQGLTPGPFIEYRGPHTTDDSNLNDEGHINDNRVRFFADPVTHAYTHPVVYIEAGSHEFWPSEFWSFPQACAFSRARRPILARLSIRCAKRLRPKWC